MTTQMTAVLLFAAALAAQQGEWLSMGARGAAPTVYAKTGTGTGNSVAEAKFTDAALRDDCVEQGFKGAAVAKCVVDRKKEEAGKIYRASADCIAGKLKPIDGKDYTFAGVWDNTDIGEGRTKWRDVSTGSIVGRDNASGGLSLSQQWEVLCPGPLKIRQPAPAAAARPAASMPAAHPTQPVCNGAPQCTEVNAFAATITDFRTSTAGGYRVVTATVRFQSKLNRPIILGYVSGAGVATDDRGNRFGMNENTGLRGLGFIRQNQVDPKFMLAAGQSSDARLEYAWYPQANAIYGLSYTLEFTVREIVPVSPTQFRVGSEHPLQFRSLVNPDQPVSPAPPAAAPTGSAAGADATLAVALVDHCAGIARCYSAGPFAAQIQNMTASLTSGYQILRINMRFRNVSQQPVVLAYKPGTSIAIDNHGQRLTQSRQPVTGMGLWGGGHANADFQLAPGQQRDATFEVQRYVARTQIGTGFTYDVAVEQLELLPANQVRSMREYTLNFTALTPTNAAPGVSQGAPSGQSVNDAVRGLKDIFKKK